MTDNILLGLELDKAVAEKVMELETSQCTDTRDWYVFTNDNRSSLMPPYSTQIAAAWQVVEKLAARGQRIELSYDPDANGDWWCCFIWLSVQEDDNYVGGVGDTAAEAICRGVVATAETKWPCS
jgi:hypothetical protein